MSSYEWLRVTRWNLTCKGNLTYGLCIWAGISHRCSRWRFCLITRFLWVRTGVQYHDLPEIYRLNTNNNNDLLIAWPLDSDLFQLLQHGLLVAVNDFPLLQPNPTPSRTVLVALQNTVLSKTSGPLQKSAKTRPLLLYFRTRKRNLRRGF